MCKIKLRKQFCSSLMKGLASNIPMSSCILFSSYINSVDLFNFHNNHISLLSECQLNVFALTPWCTSFVNWCCRLSTSDSAAGVRLSLYQSLNAAHRTCIPQCYTYTPIWLPASLLFQSDLVDVTH